MTQVRACKEGSPDVGSGQFCRECRIVVDNTIQLNITTMCSVSEILGIKETFKTYNICPSRSAEGGGQFPDICLILSLYMKEILRTTAYKSEYFYEYESVLKKDSI